MKTQRNILIAFLLNLSFSILEFIGGIFTGSVAIQSDALHDLGDAASIGLAYFLEKKSKQKPDSKYTYGYGRFSVLGSLITTCILLFGSAIMIYHAIHRIITPTTIHYDGMIVFAVIGVIVNLVAASFTHGGHSLNQKAVNLHMLEDVFGWLTVLIGAIVMRFTDFALLDPLLSIGFSIFILIHAIQNLKQTMELFLEKAPHGHDPEETKTQLMSIDGILDIHHIHIWSLDGENVSITMHIVTDEDSERIKAQVRSKLHQIGILHATLELESSTEICAELQCHPQHESHNCHGHHCHHHH